jgi:hypothetical protein
VERLRAHRVLGVFRRDDHVARLDRGKREPGERLTHGVAQTELRVRAKRPDDEAAGLRQAEHRAIGPRKLRRLFDDELHELLERTLAGRGEPDLVKRFELHRPAALDPAETPVRVQGDAGAQREEDHGRRDGRVDEELDPRVAHVGDHDDRRGEHRGQGGEREARQLDDVA